MIIDKKNKGEFLFKLPYVIPQVKGIYPVVLEMDFLEGPSVFRDNQIRATGQELDESYSTSSSGAEWDYVFD